MNNTRQLAERIVERLDNIPAGFRKVDKDALLSDIRDLYDQASDLEAVAYAPSVEPAKVEEKPIPEQPKATVTPETAPVSEIEAVPEPVVAEAPAPAVVEATAIEAEKSNDEGTLAGKLNQQPIADLGTGIPLNEKFGFIRNLFANNASDYADAILKLNNFNSSEDALGYVAKLADRKSWDGEDQNVKTFRSYIERRHLMASEANAD